MSSVLRFQKQRPSNTLYAEGDEDGIKGWLYSTIQTYADSNNGEFTASSVITFPTLSDLQGMTSDLNGNDDVVINDEVAVRDLGKNLYMGVEGEDSTQAVFKLVQIIQGANLSWVVYVNAKDMTDNLETSVARGAW